jgi:hypothetical protein
VNTATRMAVIKHMTAFQFSSIGHAYDYGGAPGPYGQEPWDCSSDQNYTWAVIGGQAIPGYPKAMYTGVDHGPSTVGWLESQGTLTASVPRELAQEGDLAVWYTHMGYCINNQEMISAQNPTDGTQKSDIDGFIPGEALTILRVVSVTPGGMSFPMPISFDGGKVQAITRDLARMAQGFVSEQMAASAPIHVKIRI